MVHSFNVHTLSTDSILTLAYDNSCIACDDSKFANQFAHLGRLAGLPLNCLLSRALANPDLSDLDPVSSLPPQTDRSAYYLLERSIKLFNPKLKTKMTAGIPNKPVDQVKCPKCNYNNISGKTECEGTLSDGSPCGAALPTVH